MRILAIRALIALVTSAVALVVAAALLDGMEITTTGVIVGAVIFTVGSMVISPVTRALVDKYADWLSIFVGLIIAFLALFLTEALTDGLDISGVDTWLIATVIVWLASIVTTLVMVRLLRNELRD